MRLLPALILLGAATPLAAQDAPAIPAPISIQAEPADPASIPSLLPAQLPVEAREGEPIANLAFEQEEPRMTVPVSISGAGPYKFVIDTGAQRTVISRQLATTLGLAPGPTVRLTAMTGTTNVGTVVIPSLSVSVFGGTRIVSPSLDARDLGAQGILGIDTLQDHAIAIDFDTQTMAISRSTKRDRRRPREENEIVVYARSLFGQLVVTDAHIGGIKVRVVLDTGSPVSLGNEALRRRVLRGKKATPIQMLSVTGHILQADYTTVSEVRIGELSINSLPVAFADATPFKAFGLARKPALLLGMDALALFRRVHIDFANRELRLTLPRDVKRRLRDPGMISASGN